MIINNNKILKNMSQPDKVSIRHSYHAFSSKVFKYETWFAMAEFVDNAIASYLKYERQLKTIEGKDFKLQVSIEINEPEIKLQFEIMQQE